jgi:peptidase M48-like protein
VRSQYPLALTLTVLTMSPAALGQSPEPPQGTQMKIDDIADRMNKSEAGLVVRMRMYHPIVEVYIQNLVPDEQLGWSPSQDEYFLGQFDLAEMAPRLRPLSAMKRSAGLLARLPGSGKGVQYLPDGFAAMAAPDWHLLDRSRYEFKFVRREFLGDARCFVFDVKPIRGSRDGFSGRIWIEDRDYNIVRFNGINRSTDQTLSTFFRRTLSFHVDGWRVNVLPGVWLPSSVYCEETDLSDARPTGRQVRFKSQVRIWGYEAQSTDRSQQLTTITIDEPAAVDVTELPRQLSPVLSQRRWEQEAEANVIERLEGVGLLAPAGEVDKVLETVLNNLVVTNEIVLERPLRCRVLLTSPLESFTVGHTIVLSRGLIDVLPDEASLATMLSHELSHVVLGHPLIDTKFAFADRLMINDGDLLQTLQFHHAAREETAADEKVIEILGKSPYKDQLSDTGLFLRVIAQQAKQLPRLIQPHIGDHIYGGSLQRVAELIDRAPALAPARLDQIPALPLGTRIVVDPWSGRLTLDRSPAVKIVSIREKVPLAVTPLMPHIKYAEQGSALLSPR